MNGPPARRRPILPRVGPFRDDTFHSDLQDVRSSARLGIALAVTFGVCFATGLLSHAIQHPPSWLHWPPSPTWGYRVTQGIHVTTGIASIPLLLAKLWSVYPRFWTWPPIAGAAHAIERLSLLPLVGGSLFLLLSGVASISRWLPFDFAFPPAHFAAAWITIGALVVHVGAKAGATRLALRGAPADRVAAGDGLSRRGFLAAAGAAAGTLILTTVGQTFRPLAPLAVLAPRDPRVGPQGLPVNKTASSARVLDAIHDPAYRLVVEGRVATPLSLSLDELKGMTRRVSALPIACVDGWSAVGIWEGVPLRDLLARAGAPAGVPIRIESLQQQRAPYSSSQVDPVQASDPDVLLADSLNGAPLDDDHGYPVRLIGPNRPGVQQTKWVAKVVVG
ncbi:MAG: molybdopterin-dependent oxidoreductase [Planctomycetaceae bacterium]